MASACEQCGAIAELMPHGRRLESGRRMNICDRCGILNEPDTSRAALGAAAERRPSPDRGIYRAGAMQLTYPISGLSAVPLPAAKAADWQERTGGRNAGALCS